MSYKYAGRYSKLKKVLDDEIMKAENLSEAEFRIGSGSIVNATMLLDSLLKIREVCEYRGRY